MSGNKKQKESSIALLGYAKQLPPANKKNRGEQDKEVQKHFAAVEETVQTKQDPIPVSDCKPVQVEWDPSIFKCGGLLEKIVDFTFSTAVRTEKLFCLAGAISLIGTLVGQRLQTESGLTTNIYCAMVGVSSCGKNAPLLMAKRVLSSVCPASFGGKDMSSDTALLRTLGRFESRRCLFGLDEVGKFLQGTKGVSNPRFGISKILTDLFTDTWGYTKPYARKEDRVEIPWHSLCVLGATVGCELWPHVIPEDFSNGFLARALFFEAKKSPYGRNLRAKKEAIPDDILDACRNLWNIDVGDRLEEVEIEGKLEKKETPPSPHTIKMTEEAMLFHEKQDKEIEKRQDLAEENDNTAESAILGRCAEIASKLALIKYTSDNAWKSQEEITEGKISLEQIKWAWLVVLECTKNTLIAIEENISSTDWEELEKRFLKAVRKLTKEHVFTDKKGKILEKVIGANGRKVQRSIHVKKEKMLEIAETLEYGERIAIKEYSRSVFFQILDE